MNARRPAELPADGEPEWLELVPAGDTVAGIDGRLFRSPGAAALLHAQRERGLRLPVDENHATQASPGRPAPAHGWIVEFREQEGALQGRVEFTERGKAALRSRDYRYFSPTYDLDWDARIPLIKGVESVGLVNIPNLGPRAALNNKESSMKDVAKKLGLSETATEQECVAAIERMRTADGQMVPKADYELMASRASTAEQQLADRDAAELRRQAEELVDGAIRDAKVAPASRDYYLSGCNSKQGVDAFREFLKTAPKVVATQAAAAGAQPNDAGADRRTPEEIEVDRQLGVEPEGAPA